MKRLTIALLALAFAMPTFAKERLVGGKGSSHKGGHYRNAKGRDRYDRRS